MANRARGMTNGRRDAEGWGITLAEYRTRGIIVAVVLPRVPDRWNLPAKPVQRQRRRPRKAA